MFTLVQFAGDFQAQLTVVLLSQRLIVNMLEIWLFFFFSFFIKTSANDWGPAFNLLSRY